MIKKFFFSSHIALFLSFCFIYADSLTVTNLTSFDVEIEQGDVSPDKKVAHQIKSGLKNYKIEVDKGAAIKVVFLTYPEARNDNGCCVILEDISSANMLVINQRRFYEQGKKSFQLGVIPIPAHFLEVGYIVVEETEELPLYGSLSNSDHLPDLGELVDSKALEEFKKEMAMFDKKGDSGDSGVFFDSDAMSSEVDETQQSLFDCISCIPIADIAQFLRNCFLSIDSKDD